MAAISLLINLPYFQLNALKPGIYRFSGFVSLCATGNELVSQEHKNFAYYVSVHHRMDET